MRFVLIVLLLILCGGSGMNDHKPDCGGPTEPVSHVFCFDDCYGMPTLLENVLIFEQASASVIFLGYSSTSPHEQTREPETAPPRNAGLHSLKAIPPVRPICPRGFLPIPYDFRIQK